MLRKFLYKNVYPVVWMALFLGAMTVLGFCTYYAWMEWPIPLLLQWLITAFTIGAFLGFLYTGRGHIRGPTVQMAHEASRKIPVVLGIKRKEVGVDDNFVVVVDGDRVDSSTLRSAVYDVVVRERKIRGGDLSKKSSVFPIEDTRNTYGREGRRAIEKVLVRSGVILPPRQGNPTRACTVDHDDAWQYVCDWWATQ